MDTEQKTETVAVEPPAGREMVRFDKVVKRYGDNVVLRELDFHVRPGSGSR